MLRAALPVPRSTLRRTRGKMGLFGGSSTTATLKVGDDASKLPVWGKPLQTDDGKSLALASFAGKPLVAFFYPAADTPGCTAEACSFRDSYTVFTDAGASVVGLSSDAPDKQAAWKAKHRLPFPLLTDPKGELRAAFGIPADLMGLLPGRQTYVFGPDGVVKLVFNSQLNSTAHTKEAVAAIKLLTTPTKA